MTGLLDQLVFLPGLLLSADALASPAAAASSTASTAPTPGQNVNIVLAVPALTILATVLCGLCAAFKVKSKLPALFSVATLAASFATIAYAYSSFNPAAGPAIAHGFDWIRFGWDTAPGKVFIADFAFYVDSLTLLWMLFVTGLATLIALYASEYMEHDLGAGYCRFFAAFNLFVFSMSCLVMADNLVLLYLGWEGVGLCSYLLIGYFYKKPAAANAAVKAFVVNRIGDLGLALGIFLCFVQFGTVRYEELWPAVKPYIDLALAGQWEQIPNSIEAIALLLMVGCFGKSAQFPLYVWLPDAMEGPTPVSALIHAATMVTAGVYLVARTLPLFAVSEYALPIVAWTGAITALLAATIGMAQFDIKRIMAYSTVSQLGFMFAGLGVLSSAYLAGLEPADAHKALSAGPFHVFTHAFFKATLFLACGAVMHGFAGQLDLRKLSGLMWMPGWRIVSLAMLVGCLNLAGFPFTAGFFSKDVILAEAFSTHNAALGFVLLLTAGLTAYYTFRVFFRVFVGPKHFEMGDEHHGDHGDHGDHSHDHADHGHGHAADHAKDPGHAHDHQPHAPKWAINFVLATLAIASIAVAAAYFTKWVPGLMGTSSAALAVQSAAHSAGHAAAEGAAAASTVAAHGAGAAHVHGTLFGQDPHKIMYYVSGAIGALGIAVAFLLHYVGRTSAARSNADNLLPALGPIPKLAQGKWFVDEIYDATIRGPLRVAAHAFHAIDQLFVDGLVNTAGKLPSALGAGLRPSQSGVMHAYAASMALGIAGLVLLAWFLMT